MYVHRCTTCVIMIFQIVIPYNETIIDFHGGEYRVIIDPIFTMILAS